MAQRYLDHTLPEGERSRFEAHLVDCQECTDRVLLAGMFLSRNGHGHAEEQARPDIEPVSEPLPVPQPDRSSKAPPARMRIVISLTQGQLFNIRVGTGLLLGGTLALLAWLLFRSRF